MTHASANSSTHAFLSRLRFVVPTCFILFDTFLNYLFNSFVYRFSNASKADLSALKYGFLLYSAENNWKKTKLMKYFSSKKPTAFDWLFTYCMEFDENLFRAVFPVVRITILITRQRAVSIDSGGFHKDVSRLHRAFPLIPEFLDLLDYLLKRHVRLIGFY